MLRLQTNIKLNTLIDLTKLSKNFLESQVIPHSTIKVIKSYEDFLQKMDPTLLLDIDLVHRHIYFKESIYTTNIGKLDRLIKKFWENREQTVVDALEKYKESTGELFSNDGMRTGGYYNEIRFLHVNVQV